MTEEIKKILNDGELESKSVPELPIDPRNPKFMETESIAKLLMRFAGPSLVGMFSQALYNIVDRVFVGQTVGASGIGAIAIAFPCMLLFFSYAMLIGIGGASRISLALGARQQEKAEGALGNGLLLGIVGGLAFVYLGSFFTQPLMRISGSSETLLPIAREYFSIILWGVIFVIVGFSLSCYIRAAGSPTYAMGSQIVGAFVNIVLDAVLVLGYGMGVKGAAIATVIAQFCSMLWACSYFFRSHARIRINPAAIIRPRLKTIARILAVGTPSCLVELNFVLVHILMNNGVQKYGGDIAVSATGIFMSMDSLLFMPALAISEACQPIVGYNYGAGRPERVIETIKFAIIGTTVFYILSFITLQLNAPFFVKLFNSKDEELIALASLAMRLANVAIPVVGVTLVTSATLQGLGRARDSLVLSLLKFGFFLVLPLLILPRFFGLYGVWGSYPVCDICGTILSAFFLTRVVQRLKNMDTSPLS